MRLKGTATPSHRESRRSTSKVRPHINTEIWRTNGAGEGLATMAAGDTEPGAASHELADCDRERSAIGAGTLPGRGDGPQDPTHLALLGGV